MAKKPKQKPTSSAKRPVYFDPVVDKLLSMIVTLAGELSVVRDRLDTVERLIEKHKLFPREEIEQFVVSDDIHAARAQSRGAFIERVLKVVKDDIDALKD
jgi:hypothetical protein